MRYAVRERMFSIGDDFWITDEQGNRIYLADGKAMRLRQTVELKDGSGAEVAVVRKKPLSVHEAMEIERDGAVVATVRKAMVSPLAGPRSSSPTAATSRRSATSWTRSSRSPAAGGRWRGSRVPGSGFGTPTGWMWPPGRTTSCSWRWP